VAAGARHCCSALSASSRLLGVLRMIRGAGAAALLGDCGAANIWSGSRPRPRPTTSVSLGDAKRLRGGPNWVGRTGASRVCIYQFFYF
jgi:hypothetical protein